MKKHSTRLLLTLALFGITLTGCDALTNIIDKITGNGGNNNTTSTDYDIDLDNAPDNIKQYYKNCGITQYQGTNLMKNLHKLMWDTHTNEVLYSNFSTYCKKQTNQDSIEAVPGTNYNQLFYSGKTITGYSGTREHVWPCANSSGLWIHDKDNPSNPYNVDRSQGYRGGGSDLYHVRLCNSSTNSARGNGKYIDFDDFPQYTSNDITVITEGGQATLWCIGLDSNRQYANKVEVLDSFKGDIARIVGYVWLHYSTFATTPADKKSETATLSLMNILGYSDEKTCKEKLVEWNRLDPPNDVEKHRNDTIQAIQGNRNPFVDFPELMAAGFNVK